MDQVEAEVRCELALEAMGVGVSDWDLVSGQWFASPQLERLLGLAAGALSANRAGFEQRIHPEDRAAATEAMAAARASERRQLTQRCRVQRADGEERWLESASSLLFGPGGELRRVVTAYTDITERLEDDVRRRTHAEELAHRLKNTLTLVQAMARQSFRPGPSSAALEDFERRLQGLAASHDMLTARAWASASVMQVIAGATRPYLPHENRLHAHGPDIELGARAAVALGLALNELATNAAKYGALSGPAGEVRIDWAADGEALHLTWREVGGPKVIAPGRRGFGRRLLEQGVAADLEGQVSLEFRPDGVVCEIVAALGDQAERASI